MKIDLVVGAYIVDKSKILLIHHKKLKLWLPVGGHIEKDEIPDDALHREIKEEVNLKVQILSTDDIQQEGNTKRICATPFHVSVHSVGDHDHCCFFYVCKALNPESLKINDEVTHAQWFSREQLSQVQVPLDVRNIGLKALEIANSFPEEEE